LFLALLLICYYQHDFVVRSYQKQTMEDTLLEQRLKKDMYQKEFETKVELQRSMLKAENQILEDRASLSQTLHDKLGHGINGSIYQLEAIKVLMKKDPEKSGAMIQAVIDQLRVSMDEIRAILRKERPEKKELALLQLYKLCEDCNAKGVEATLETEGDASLVPEKAWEVILDNAFEAVTNSMKYAKCKKIEMKIVVMNQMIRCSISDDGKGCLEIKEGMGIAGMRRRVREAGGTITFETQAGFTVNMLLPF
jgi:signal transduction histidine kinase